MLAMTDAEACPRHFSCQAYDAADSGKSCAERKKGGELACSVRSHSSVLALSSGNIWERRVPGSAPGSSPGKWFVELGSHVYVLPEVRVCVMRAVMGADLRLAKLPALPATRRGLISSGNAPQLVKLVHFEFTARR